MTRVIEMHVKSSQGNLEEGNCFEVCSVVGKIHFIIILKKQGWKVWTGFVYIKTGNSGGLF
jgi:hypothetical protein